MNNETRNPPAKHPHPRHHRRGDRGAGDGVMEKRTKIIDMDINKFKTNLGLAELPQELEKLILFQTDQSDKVEYSDGFAVRIDKKTGLKYGWSKDPDFLSKLLPFARANASGSFYALWIDDDDKPLSQLPVVVFGDEGGEHIVAENILQLLHLITFDSEIKVDKDHVAFKNRRKKQSDNLEKYLCWLKENFDLDRVEKPETAIKNAQAKYKDGFDEWVGRYVKKVDERVDMKFHLKMLNSTSLNEKAKQYNIKKLKGILKTKQEFKEFIKDEIKIVQSDEMRNRILTELKID